MENFISILVENDKIQDIIEYYKNKGVIFFDALEDYEEEPVIALCIKEKEGEFWKRNTVYAASGTISEDLIITPDELLNGDYDHLIEATKMNLL